MAGEPNSISYLLNKIREALSTISGKVGGYNETLDVVKVLEQGPLDQQILAPQVMLNAVTTDSISTYCTVSDKQRVTAYVYCTGGSATLEMMGKPSADATAIALPVKDSVSGNVDDSLALASGVNYVVSLDGNVCVAEIAAKVSSVTGATVTVIIIGGVL